MKNFFIVFTSLSILFFLNACATFFQRPDPNANYGTPPHSYEESIKSHFNGILKDPESARYKFEKPIKAYGNEGLLSGGKVSWIGYLVDVQINAKNSYGGYVGFTPYMVIFSGNKVVTELKGNDLENDIRYVHIDGNSVMIHRLE